MFCIRMFRIVCLICIPTLLPAVAAAQNLVDAAIAGDVEALHQALPEAEQADPETLVQPLYFAAQRGRTEAVAFLISRGAPANAMTKFGSALQIAARGNHTDIVAMLLAAGADPNLPGGEEDKTPLHDAAERGAIDAARLLLEHGADINARTASWGQPAIHLAARKGKDEMVRLLRDMGAGPAPVDPLAPGELEAADLEEGRIHAVECRSCHELEAGQETNGPYPAPKLIGVVGRDKASRDDFAYSDAMLAQAGNWTPDELNIFLSDPTAVVPGTHMGHRGLSDRGERVAVIAYLISLASAAK